jgi:hypothetical protein
MQMNDPEFKQEWEEAKAARLEERAEAKLERAEAKVERAEERAEEKLDREKERMERKEDRKIEKREATVIAKREARRRAKWQAKKDAMVNETILRIDNAEQPREVFRDREAFLDHMELHANHRQNYQIKTTRKIREKRIKKYSNVQRRENTTITFPKYKTSAVLTEEQIEEKIAMKEEELRIAYGGDADDESENTFRISSSSFVMEGTTRRRSNGEVPAQGGNVRGGFQKTGAAINRSMDRSSREISRMSQSRMSRMSTFSDSMGSSDSERDY